MEQPHKPGRVPLSPEEYASWYAGTLIRLVIAGERTSAQLTSGETLPDLADLATTPEMLAEVESLPFKHDELDADEVIGLILRQAGWGPFSFFKSTGTLRIPIATEEGTRFWTCGVRLSKGPGGKRLLLLER